MDFDVTFSPLCVSSSNGGGGKTLLTLGIGRALTQRGISVKPFKKGPDYIDSAWLSRACHVPATNLDSFFLPPAKLEQLFIKSLARLAFRNDKKDVLALVEGNRGLYDGLDEYGSCSTSNLARLLKAPILLCLNCEKSTRTVAAMVRGLTSFEDGLVFSGLILNRVGSPRHADALRKAIELDTDLEIRGVLPRLPLNPLPERHMGLASFGSGLARDVEKILDGLANFISENCDLDAILASLPRYEMPIVKASEPEASLELSREDKPRIGFVRDSAFWFYYPENLEALEKAGALLVPLKIVDANQDEQKKWDNVDALYLGGGFPEDFARELSESPIIKKIAAFAADEMPIYAECGGLVLLCKSLSIQNNIYKMAGVFPHRIKWLPKPQGLGYVEGEVRMDNPYFPAGQTLRGHEFHYSACVPDTGKNEYGLALKRGTGISQSAEQAFDALLHKNVWASYTHIFAPAIPCWAKNFVDCAKNWRTP